MTSLQSFLGLLSGILLCMAPAVSSRADERVLVKDLGFDTGDYTDDIHSAATSDAVFVSIPLRVGVRDSSMLCKVDESGNVVLQKDVRELFSGSSNVSLYAATLRDLHTLGDYVYVTGDFWNFSPTYRLSYALKLDSSLNVVASATFHGSSFSGSSVDLRSIYPVLKSDGTEEIFVAGDFDCSTVYVSSGSLNQGSQPAGYGVKVTKESSKRQVLVVRLNSDFTPAWGANWSARPGSTDLDMKCSAVTGDPLGNVFVATQAQAWPANASSAHLNAPAFFYTNQVRSISRDTQADMSNVAIDFQLGPVPTANTALAFVVKLSSDGTPDIPTIADYQMEMTENSVVLFQATEVRDLVYDSGYLFVMNEWSGFSARQGAYSLDIVNTDVGICRLNAMTLRDDSVIRACRIAGVGKDDAGHLFVGEEGIYFSMLASAGPHFFGTNDGTTVAPLKEIGSGSLQRSMWGRVSTDMQTLSWSTTPEEPLPPTVQLASIAAHPLSGMVFMFGNYSGGTLTAGKIVNRVTLPVPSGGARRAYIWARQPSGDDALAVDITTNSAIAAPSIASGTTAVLKGSPVALSVPPVIYRDSTGGILDSPTDEQIRTLAVTRHTCTGYAVKDTVITGTTSYYNFVASQSTEVTFNWHTDYAVDVESDVAGSHGLTSTAAGSPDPVVQKHWIGEDEQFTAQVDGAAFIGTLNGVRWRSTGYVATGCVADAAGVADGATVTWASYQNRQQTPKITVGKPGKIIWKWQKEFRLQVSANSTLASEAPYVDVTALIMDIPAATTPYTAASVSGFPGSGGAVSGTGWPTAESPDKVNDGLASTKYLNFAKTNTGVIMSYATAIAADRIQLTTAADAQERDPTSIQIEGRTAAGQPWVTIVPVLNVTLPTARGAMQEFGFTNETAYVDYRITVLTLRTPATATAMQVAEIKLLNLVDAHSALTNVAPFRILSGSGEAWAAPGTQLQAGSAASVSGGIGSLALKGYTGGTGSVVPFDTRGVTSKALTLNAASSIIWDYARTIYPETVTIGGFITFSSLTGVDATNANRLKAPAGGSVSNAPNGSTWNDMQAWDQVGQKLYPLRPGVFTVEFENTAAPGDTTQNVIVEVTAVWPASTDYTHIIETPAVDLDPDATDARAYKKLAFTEAAAVVNSPDRFSNTEEGRSVLLFSVRAGGSAATGNLTQESLSVKTVRSRFWRNAVGAKQNVTIGAAITTADHDISAVGHNGYVLTRLAPVNSGVYDLASQQGPIIPVNIEYPPFGQWTAADNPGMLAIAWYQVQDGLRWPYKASTYSPQWPVDPPRIVIAGQLGSESLRNSFGIPQDTFTAPVYTALSIYNQPDNTLPGFNPNEEHALIAPSFLNATRGAAFALRNGDLNHTTLDADYTSQPYVLVNYRDVTDLANPVPKMAVYAIQQEDAATTDPRLPAFNQTYVYRYQGEAGRELVPPYPLANVIGATPQDETDGINVDPQRIAYYEDKTSQPWIISGDVDLADDIRAVFYYPLRGDFWHPVAAVGDPLRFGPASPGHNISYNTIWPADSAVLKAGETLTFSGGEYASDHAGDIPAPSGLPGAVAWQSGRVAFDEFNPALDTSSLISMYLVRVIPALTAREVPLPVSALPDDLKPASGNVMVDGSLWRFKALSAGLQQRIYYNSLTGMLGVRGYLNGRTLGDPTLTAAPGAQTILQPNVLTPAEGVTLAAVSSDSNWLAAASALVALSRDPASVPSTTFGVGLAPLGPTGSQPASAIGPGLAVITNPRLMNPAFAPGINSGYVTIAENDDPALGDAPVVMHVMRVTRTEVYRGSLAPIYPDNVFDEKITVRHTGDFGSDVDSLYFEWRYREEDGRALNPPGVIFPTSGAPGAGDWQLFAGAAGLNEIQLAGASAALLSDNLFFCRYRHNDADGNVASNWSQWAGAANSRPPNVASPSAATDAAYVAQLVAGWVKRVTDAVNVFDARISDFRNNDAPATYTSMIQQAGQRYEGPVAFNPTKDVIENYGMIELYQTVLERAKDLSIDLAPGTSGINTALLNAANRISQFYTLIGNEAYSDALDPTIGYSTQSSQYGALSPTIHAFQNQTADLLDEELSLLRGRGEVGARPAYNRLLWNFTNGQGEAAYAMNYAITDVNSDGFINANDGRMLYPQGHGDAWGHYTMALKGYADLFTNSRFSWDPRSELYQINGVVFNIDYLDERAFAEAAATRAKAGAEIVDLVYRQKYTENPAGQWQGYQDTNTDRAWGVYEWGQRAATAAYFDWAVGNALLPASDTTHEGIQKVDRGTVGGLGVLAGNATLIQSKVESADRGHNPLGLDPNVVPFDIDPVRVDRASVNPATHFEQVYERAVAASSNAITTWDHANQLNNLLRRTGASTEQLRQQTKQQDLDYRNRLIEIFGTPYAGTIGAGQAYPDGYSGPDLYLFMYVDTTQVGDVTTPKTPPSILLQLRGLFDLTASINPFEPDVTGQITIPGTPIVLPDGSSMPGPSTTINSTDYARDYLTNWFPADYTKDDAFTSVEGGSLTLEYPVTASGYAFNAPSDWGMRDSPGKLQIAIAELIQAEADVVQASANYDGLVTPGGDLDRKLRNFTAKAGIAAQDIRAVTNARSKQETMDDVAIGLYAAAGGIRNVREFISEMTEGVKEGIPETWDSFGAIIKGVMAVANAPTQAVMRGLEFGADTANYGVELKAGEIFTDLQLAETQWGYQSDVIDMLDDLEDTLNSEPDLRFAAFRAIERLRSASDKYRALLQEGLRLVNEREAFNKRVASTTTSQRYEDMTFRVTRNDALRKYRSAYDMAARYAYLAGKAYAYELNLPDNHAANATPLLAEIIRTRDLGVWQSGAPVLAHGGLASHLATLKGNYDHFKGQMGFNNPSAQIYTFSLRADLGRVPLSTREDAAWRQKLETWRVPDLWNYTHTDGVTNYGFIYRRFCRPFAPEFNGSGSPVAQPALVIPFTSTIQSGKNWFDNTLAAGDSALNSSEFATKIRAVGVRLDSYNTSAMSVTPQVYLIPLGADRMFMPEGTTLQTREWNVVDQRIPAPLPITPSQLSNPAWHPFTGSTSGHFDEIRKFSSFRAFPDSVGTTRDDIISSSRLVGRSAWNTRWVLIIPNAAILYDTGSTTAGIDTFIHGLPKSGETQSTSGTDPAKRDLLGVRDIKLMIETYSVSGN